MNEEKIIVETSTKTASYGKKPRIEEGVYKGLLTEIKLRKDKEGNPVVAKYGEQAILIFLIIDKKTNTPVTYKTEDGEEKPVELAQIIYTRWKNKDGEMTTAFTPKSQSTQTFKALGWKGPDNETLVLNDYLNKECKLFVEDYEVKVDGSVPYKASRINKISPLEG